MICMIDIIKIQMKENKKYKNMRINYNLILKKIKNYNKDINL